MKPNSGEYSFDYLRLSDNAFSANEVTYRSDGRLEYYDRQNEETVSKYDVNVDIDRIVSPLQLVLSRQLPRPKNNGTIDRALNLLIRQLEQLLEDFFKFNIMQGL